MLVDMITGWPTRARRLLRVLPEEGTLPKADRLQRHRAIPWLLSLRSVVPFRLRAVAACIGLLTASAVIVHFANDGWAKTWQWAAICDALVLGSCAALIRHRRLSEMHQAERARAEEVQRDSERKLSTLMSNLPGMAYRCANDADWTTEFVSEGSLELTGYTPDELMGGAFARLIHADDRDRLWHDTQAAVSAQRAFQHEYRIQTRDGWERWVFEQGRAVYGANGEVLALEAFISDISERRRAAEELAHQARHDPLTDLPNRNLLRHELQEALRTSKTTGEPLALLMMDLDHFKEVNDTFGHRYGDELLRNVGERLQQTVPDRGVLARLGGDEFGILLRNADANHAVLVADRLVKALGGSFPVQGHNVALGASVGVALFPDHSADSETLLRYADVAMYIAKRAGGGFEIYSVEQDSHSADRLALTRELRQAIDQNQLVLYYQPTIDCSKGQITGVEALVRWHHPERGLVPPDQFIPLAEQSGAINELTGFVLREALHQCRLWRDAGFDLVMSVNLSLQNLHDPRLPETIAGLLRAEALAPEWINLEITESAILADPNRALAVLEELRALGVRLAIDDFGTGYSSMAYLKGLSVDALKIDRSFVRNLATDRSNRAIVRSAVELAHNLGLDVVAEGVEDTISYQHLAHLGCDLAQGYYMARPMSAEAIERWLTVAPFGLEADLAAA